jgi:hypothetical protein
VSYNTIELLLWLSRIRFPEEAVWMLLPVRTPEVILSAFIDPAYKTPTGRVPDPIRLAFKVPVVILLPSIVVLPAFMLSAAALTESDPAVILVELLLTSEAADPMLIFPCAIVTASPAVVLA